MSRENFKAEKIITLFFSAGGIGEVILQTPFYQALKRTNPACIVTALLSRHGAQVLRNNPHVDDLRTFGSARELMQLLRRTGKRAYDTCYIFDKSWKANYLATAIIRARRYVGFERKWWEALTLTTKIRYSASQHETSYYFDLLESGHTSDCSPQMFPSEADCRHVAEFLDAMSIRRETTICLLPGGANNAATGDEPFRRWPIERYSELAVRLLDNGFTILLIGAQTDVPLHNTIAGAVRRQRDRVIDLGGKLSLVQSGIAAGRALCAVGHDSGLLHLASCFNPNLICLYGITSPRTLLPAVRNAKPLWADEDIYDPRARIYGTRAIPRKLRLRCFQRLIVDRVYQECVSIIAACNAAGQAESS